MPFLPGLPFAQGLPSRTFTAGIPHPGVQHRHGPAHRSGWAARGARRRGVVQIPLWITENGIANSDDSQRASYIVRHLAVVQDAVADGMDIRGYVYWSLTDVLEWSNGYEDKFGLYSFDPHAGANGPAVRRRRPSTH